ncbi:MAG: glutathione S-transferase family protein [Gammaproteobacteria bacterium]
MSAMTLVIGNKNYSSWSLRPWLLLRHSGIPFEEVRFPLYRDDTRERIAALSPSGLVPVLRHGDVAVWDSLAICEHVNELYPAHLLWPADPSARAVARAASAEMHAGFRALREHMPMNCRGYLPGRGLNPETEKDIRRILALWRHCRTTYGDGGPMLFGGFSIADAMFAPVALRFQTYDVKLDPVGAAYVSTLLALPAMVEWVDAARREPERLEQFEPYG